jgi:hypothetical protein
VVARRERIVKTPRSDSPPQLPETLSEVVDRLSAQGYGLTFKAEPGGLRAVESGALHAPESLVIDEMKRFEGLTDPADEAVVFALRSPATGAQGTFVAAFGPKMSPAESEAARRLSERS